MLGVVGNIGPWELILIVILLSFLLLPVFIAFKRDTVNKKVISAISILLGWTGIGFIAALLWALIDTPAANQRINHTNSVIPVDELKKYKQLLDDGVITQEEFDAMKQKLLKLDI